MQMLPKWVLPPTLPSIYDTESFTALEMVAKVYGAINTLIEEYNVFADKVNEDIAKYEESQDKDFELFAMGIRQEFQDFIDVIEMQLSSQDKELEEMEQYIKSNLAAAVSEVLNDMQNSGELDAAITNAIAGMGKVITAIRRKVIAISGSVRDIYKTQEAELKYTNCRVSAVEENHVTIAHSGGAFNSSIRLQTHQNTSNGLEVSMISGYGTDRTSVYYATGTTKRLINCIIDDKVYTDMEAIRNVGLSFRELILNYEVDNDDGNIAKVTTRIHPEGFTICETPTNENLFISDTLITGKYVTSVFEHAGVVKVFTMSNGLHYMTEKMQTIGTSVIKDFRWRGGL